MATLPTPPPWNPGGSGNPILDEIDRKHGELSPGAQRAIAMSGVPQSALGATPGTPQPPAAMRTITPPVAGPTPIGLKPPEQQQDPAQTARVGEFNRLTAPPLQGDQAHTKANTGVSGIEQIHNPWARIPLQALNAIGTGFFPRLAMGVPGTSLHHQALVHDAEGAVNEGEKLQTDQAARQHLGAETEQLGAQTTQTNAKTNAIRNPPPKQGDPDKTIETDQGIMQFNPETGKYDIQAGQAPGKSQQSVHVLPDGRVISITHDQKTGEVSGKVVYQGDPAVKTEVKQLQIGNKPHQVLINTQTGETIKDLGESGEKPPVVNVSNQTRADKREHLAEQEAALKVYQPGLNAAQRFNVMAQNYKDATDPKHPDQQAMVSMLMNHIGMTLGDQKGARITKDVIHEAASSLPFLDRVEKTFGPDGVLSGITLSPDQMKQMLNLGRGKFSEAMKNSTSQARYIGSTDQGPDRIPSDATLDHYMELTKGNKDEARKMLIKDGWSIK